MKNCVVRQAIKDLKDTVIGYELLIQEDESSLYNSSSDNVAANTMVAFLSENSERIFKDKKTFMTFTPTLLFRNTPKIFDKDKVVIQIEDNIVVHSLAAILISKYREDGYHFAINDFQFTPKYFSMLEYVDYIKMDISNKLEGTQRRSIANVIDMAHGFQKQFIATGVNSKEVYDCAVELGVDYVEGNYIAGVTTSKASKMDFMQGNLYQLIVEITKDEPDVEILEETIIRDASLTYALLKMANSAYFAVHHETTSVRQALVRVGISQLKQWVYLLSFEDKQNKSESEELLKASFMRANFTSALVKRLKNFPINSSDAYLLGMFSMLEYMIDAPIAEILYEIPILEEVKDALIRKEGKAGRLYELVLSYEKADWSVIKEISEELGLKTNEMAQIYMECVEEVNNIWDNVVGMNEEA
ncbi:HDOD domain-containing protein [Lachnospiraceae bacterium WCA-9-b2]|jgi:EAL and modified HD-GYP domain-containing signal transduction protein|uniref:HDOD domain-containing protein n=1 Tax=Sporofaciens musculi TaxID=2681861 RepID=A0A7X3MLY6_9FIRM|nr:HDOD domain-containing protein [Sporofaciens musculi]MCI9423489.1 HDOD domain-containing protein [Dorea sp.]MXP78874.1 HDOD domain-containing protein [Sporofaciens musculi]